MAYQNAKPDQFYYRYDYDAENRITGAWSSIAADTSTYFKGSTLDPTKKRLDASYQYYLHGPLARMELGDVNNKVQGTDYAYTLQGWIKGVNAQDTVGNLDIGQDGIVSNRVAKDAYGYSLGYYHDDYKPIGGGTYAAFAKQYTQNPGDITGQSLYNGNISTATYAIRHINNYDPVGYTYHYDQLNRLKKLRQHSSISTWNNSNINGGYSENFDYDGNGNILTLLRAGASSTVTDSLTYKYNRDVNGQLTDNKLNYLHGTGNATRFGPAQSANNYTYDPIGNLTKDTQSHLGKVAWSVYGKIDTIQRGTDTTIIYRYNTTQERISKTLTTTSGSLTTYYLRDAQGNTIALYDNKASAINWREQHLYGSSRLGMWQPNINLTTGGASTKWDTAGYKLYELNNHLGNVLATITDKRIANTGYYTPDVTTAQDYYGFGALMPGRQFKTDSNYRYGFNGKENDNDVKGVGNEQDYGMRIYDPRVGRFLSVDPISPKYPELTPYQFSSNSPIANIDEDGLEATPATANNTQLNAANDIVSQNYDPNHNRKDISQQLISDIAKYAKSAQGQQQMKTAGDLQDFYKLVFMVWRENSYSDIASKKGSSYRRLISESKTIAEKAAAIRKRSASMESEMVKANLIGEGLSAWYIGAMASSIPSYSPNSSSSFKIRSAEVVKQDLVKIETVEDGVMIFSSKVGNETVEGITNYSVKGDQLILDNLHLQGSEAGNVGRQNLWNMARDLGRQYKVKEVLIQGGRRTTGKYKGTIPSPQVIKVN